MVARVSFSRHLARTKPRDRALSLVRGLLGDQVVHASHSFRVGAVAVMLVAVACSGASGDADAGRDAGESCDRLIAEYTAAVAAAKACTPGAANQCQVLVATGPEVCPNLACGSQEFVNEGTRVEAARGKWIAACVPMSMQHSCPNVPCGQPPPASICASSGAAGAGTCRSLEPMDAGS
jgi:hypothetical protein